MANNKSYWAIGAPLGLATDSSVDSETPKQRGRSSELSPPCFARHDPTSPTGSTTGPVSDFGSLSLDAADLVYPIRSVVSISNPPKLTPSSPNTPWNSSNGVAESVANRVPAGVCVGLGIHMGRSKSPGGSPGRQPSIVLAGMTSEEASRLGSSGASLIVEDSSASGEEEMADDNEIITGGTRNDREGGYVATRFEHKMTGDGHCVITGVSGSEKMQRCEDEPIHIPGAVQGFGVLVALKEDANGKLGVKVVSEVGFQLSSRNI